ncbi:hypothetical protein D3C72_2302650 [compost metagenome]
MQLAQRAFGGLRHEVVLGCKVAIEATVRQPRALHEVGHANAIETFLTEQLRGRLQDALAVFCHLFLADFHRIPLVCCAA